MELGKVPPHDIEAEQAVIGSMLTDKEAVASAIETLKEEDFYREDNKAIYEAWCRSMFVLNDSELKKLAEEKNNIEQIHMCFEAARTPNWKTQID